MTSLIVGLGEIGKSVKAVIGQGVNADKVYTFDMSDDEMPVISHLDILHVCYPFDGSFADMLDGYIKKYKPWHIIIWATVPIGTTKRFKGAVHSPVEGRHPKLESSIRNMARWLGVNDFEEGKFMKKYFGKFLLKTRVVSDSNYTEALKLLSTTEYGVNVEFARYKKHVADKLKMDYALTKEWNRDYNKLYHNLDMDWAQKYVLDAPKGPKGGHCVTPNAQLLQKQYPNDLVKIVGEL